MSLRKKLAAWREAGLIDAQAADRIARYEEEHARGAQWVVWGISAAGGLAIATGLISLIAANWSEIPDGLKLAVGLLLLLGTVGGAWRAAALASTWPRDLFLFLHDGMVLALVGLVGQVYHLHGAPWRAFALCAVLALPPALIAAQSLLTDVVAAHLVLALAFLLADSAWLDRALDHLDWDFALGFVIATVGLVFFLAARAVAPLKTTIASAFKRWGVGLTVAAVLLAASVWGVRVHEHYWHVAEPGAVTTPFVLFLVATALVGGQELLLPASGRISRWVALGLVVALLSGTLLVTRVGGDDPPLLPWQLLGFALFCALCAAFAIVSANAGRKLLTNLCTLALAARVLILYFELAKDLLTTGLGLILTGLVCLGVAYGWWRLRRFVPVGAAPVEPGGAA